MWCDILTINYTYTHNPGQLSLAIPPWVGAMSTSESWDENRHTTRCTGSESVVSGVWLRAKEMEISAAQWA